MTTRAASIDVRFWPAKVAGEDLWRSCGQSVEIGAAGVKPYRQTVLFAGDSGIIASLNDLDTAALCDVPLAIAVPDGGGFDAEKLGHCSAAARTAAAPKA